MIKGSIQEDITIVNIYAPNIGAPPYIKQILTAIKGEINSNTIIVGNYNTPRSPMDRSSKMKINKETQALNDILNKMDLIDIYRTFQSKTTEGFPGGAVAENLPANAGDTGSSPGLGRSHMPRSN